MSFHENNIYLISMSILITCLLDNVWILKREVRFQSLLGVKGLKKNVRSYQVSIDKSKEY